MQLHPERQTHKTIILGSHTGPGFTVVYLMSSKSTWAFTHTHTKQVTYYNVFLYVITTQTDRTVIHHYFGTEICDVHNF